MKAQRVVGGAVRTEKVDCQNCGKVKELGIRCEVCEWPKIEVFPKAGGRFLVSLPLCPSTNDRMEPVRMGRYARMRLTDDASDYIKTVGAELRIILERAAESHGFKPLATWAEVKVWTVLPRTVCDGHNYFKVLFDALELGGYLVNDKYALPNLVGIAFDKNPHMAVEA